MNGADGALWGAFDYTVITEPDYPVRCSSCSRTYLDCTKKIQGGRGACCSECRDRVTHDQDAWELWRCQARRQGSCGATHPKLGACVMLVGHRGDHGRAGNFWNRAEAVERELREALEDLEAAVKRMKKALQITKEKSDG